MKDKLCNKLFNKNICKATNICISMNEAYIQLILYIFLNSNNNLLLVYPTLNEATNIYNQLNKYLDKVYLYPEDDFMMKKAVAASPELLFLRLNLLNNLTSKENKIVIVHYNSFIRKLADPNQYQNKKIVIKKNMIISREELLSRLADNNYRKETLVTEVSEFSVRGFVVDVFPLQEEKPIRIEFFDDTIEKIKYFDPLTQLTTREVTEICIPSVKEENEKNNNSILDYLPNAKTIYTNYNELKKVEKSAQPQIEYLNIDNDIFTLKQLCRKEDVYLDTINNYLKNCITINSSAILKKSDDKDDILGEINENNGYLFSTNKKLNDLVIDNYKNIKLIKQYLGSSFKFDNEYYYSEIDMFERKPLKDAKINVENTSKIKNVDKIKIGDYVVHKKSGIGIYMGIKVIEKDGLKKDYILIQYKGNDKLYVPVEDISKLYKYSSKEGVKPTIHKLNSLEWVKTKLKIKEKIKSITGELLKLYKERNKITVEPFTKDDENQVCFESEFSYTATDDQLKASEQIKKDMENKYPMERLLCGDVGYGKTEVIFRAIFKAIINKKQVAYLCPTTVLSHQQYEAAIERFKNFGVSIDIINRHFTNKEVQNKLKRLKEGKTDLIIGTHRLLSNDVEYNDLGLLVIDEEHRFGVSQKEKIKEIKKNVHVLSVSATPIPRSLQMSLVGIRDMSLIETAPQNRYPVQTYVIEYNDVLLREAVLKEMSRKGQTYILYNNVEKMEKKFNDLKKLIPEARIIYAHGKMQKDIIQENIYDFTNGKYDILLSTTIIENGIDIPNANTMIVIDADRFGLSQLYQIRGRVGRSDRIAYAYLMYKKEKSLSSIALKRLDAIKEFTELGSGYKISLRDLSIRGAGDILGSEQAGFIDSVGVDMYLDLINEGINGIDEDDSNDVVSLNVDTHIGEEYSQDSSIIIEIHKMINAIESKEDIDSVLDEIKDRFGIVDNKILTYANEKYFEVLLKKSNAIVFENSRIKLVLRIKKEVLQNLDTEKLFIEISRLSTKINFQYKSESLYLTLPKVSFGTEYVVFANKILEILLYSRKTE